jgi:tetratricopeptide (TPR) repeat protein
MEKAVIVNQRSSLPIKRLLARLSLLGMLLLGLSVSEGCGRKESAKASTKAYDKGVKAVNRGDYDLAIAELSEAIRLDTNYADAYFERGMSYDEKREYDRAIADYSEAIRLKPDDNFLVYEFRGDAYARKGDFDKAIADYSDSIRLKPDYYTDSYSKRGDAYLSRGLDSAMKNLPEKIKEGPAYRVSGSELHDYDKAIADYSEIIRVTTNVPLEGGIVNDNTVSAYRARANAYDAKGDYKNAIADYTEAVRLEPNADTYSALATLYTSCSDVSFRNGEKAVACAKRKLVNWKKREG